jgi:hypothetical protein
MLFGIDARVIGENFRTFLNREMWGTQMKTEIPRCARNDKSQEFA